MITEIQHTDLEAVFDLLAVRSGLAFPSVRRSDTEDSIRRLMKESRCASVADYLRHLEQTSTAMDELIDRVTVGETYFFRDPQQLDFVRDVVLRDFIAERDRHEVIRIWSAGCASGEEAYTLAILLDRAGLLERSHVLATDISRAAVERAKRGAYGRWSFRNRNVSLDPYFTRQGSSAVIAPRFRNGVHFEVLNLALDLYPSVANGTAAMDLILCRNVMIYLGRDTIRAIARRLFDSLAAGGFLIVGHSDPVLADHAPFETLLSEGGVVYRRARTPDSRGVVCASRGPSEARETRAPLPEPIEDEHSLVENIRALANLSDAADTESVASAAVARYPLSAELQFLHAILLISLGRHEEAAGALRRVIYLDGSLAIAHFVLASVLQRLGDLDGARRRYRNVQILCLQHSADAMVPFADGERMGSLAESAATHLSEIGDFSERART